mmetsp:Transcript_31249/g.61875  ORF Transcript_31249/g.61875 Transcript_31249/m.61875 type:complete len:106 (-) Transcript_31249:22-339(-)
MDRPELPPPPPPAPWDEEDGMIDDFYDEQPPDEEDFVEGDDIGVAAVGRDGGSEFVPGEEEEGPTHALSTGAPAPVPEAGASYPEVTVDVRPYALDAADGGALKW